MNNKPQRYVPGTKILDQRHADLAPEDGDIGFTRMFVQWEKDAEGREVAKGIDETNRTAEFVISSGEVDRYGEIVDPKAFDRDTIKAFMQNPVMLAAHQHSGWNGESTVIGRWLSIRREGDQVIGVCRFNTSKLGEEYWQLVRSGDLRACSIGFLVRAWEMREVGEGDAKRSVRVFVKIELLEISIVAVPANRQALLKAAGFSSLASIAATIDGDHDAGHAAAIAKELVEKLNKGVKAAIDQSLQAAVEKTLIKIFSDPESVGPRFAKLIAGYLADSEGLYARAFDDVPDEGDESPASQDKATDPLAAMFG